MFQITYRKMLVEATVLLRSLCTTVANTVPSFISDCLMRSFEQGAIYFSFNAENVSELK